jgi:2-polyprenyl-3-methyl-5-hydroxy-6-metoxy-1,4-benzoquinol methylase
MHADLTDFSIKAKGYYVDQRKEMLKYIPEGAEKSLEFGCANGRFSTLIKKKFGLEAWAVEMDKGAADEAAKKLDRVINADAHESLKDIPYNYFDCIIFNDILEHLIDPYSLLISVKTKLTDDGVIVVSIPNVRYCRHFFDFVIKGNWDYQDGGTLDKTHLRFFTSRSILKMFKHLGFDVLLMEGIQPTQNKKLRLLNTLLFKTLEDLMYFRFATVVRPVKV